MIFGKINIECLILTITFIIWMATMVVWSKQWLLWLRGKKHTFEPFQIQIHQDTYRKSPKGWYPSRPNSKTPTPTHTLLHSETRKQRQTLRLIPPASRELFSTLHIAWNEASCEQHIWIYCNEHIWTAQNACRDLFLQVSISFFCLDHLQINLSICCSHTRTHAVSIWTESARNHV